MESRQQETSDEKNEGAVRFGGGNNKKTNRGEQQMTDGKQWLAVARGA